MFVRILNASEEEVERNSKKWGRHIESCSICRGLAMEEDARLREMLRGVKPLGTVLSRPRLSRRRLEQRLRRLLDEEWEK